MTDDSRRLRTAATLQKTNTALLALILAALTFLLALVYAVITAAAQLDAVLEQAACIWYADFVLDQHGRGLSADEIQAVIAHAAGAGGDSEATPFSSAKACGSASDVLRAAGRN